MTLYATLTANTMYFTESGEQYDLAYEEDEEDVADLGEHKSVIMSLLGQLKLGMDLTKVRGLSG